MAPGMRVRGSRRGRRCSVRDFRPGVGISPATDERRPEMERACVTNGFRVLPRQTVTGDRSSRSCSARGYDSAARIAHAGACERHSADRPTLGVLWGETNGTFTASALRLTSETGIGYDLAAWFDPLQPNGPQDDPPAVPPNYVAMTNSVTGRVHVFRYAGNRTFDVVSSTGVPSKGITANQLAADGFKDLACTVYDANVMRWFLGDGTGVFNLEDPQYFVDLNPFGIASGTLIRGDTSIDLVTANVHGYTGYHNHGNVSVLVNSGNEQNLFQRYDFPVMTPLARPKPRQVLVADLNRDGYNDIITANMGPPYQKDDYESVSVLINVP